MGESINLVNKFKAKEVIFNCGKHNYLEKINYYTCINEYNINNMEVLNKSKILRTNNEVRKTIFIYKISIKGGLFNRY